MKSLSAKRERIPYLQLNVRRNTFLEASAGYSEEEAKSHAEMCSSCGGSPCAAACPVGTAVPRFLAAVAEGDFTRAYDAVAEANPLAAICSRVCAVKPQCEASCAKARGGVAVNISALERFVCDFALREGKSVPSVKAREKNRGRVAVVGAGLSGLSCAGALAKKGFKVTLFDGRGAPGACILDVIPEFRLPKEAVAQGIKSLGEMGVEFAAGEPPRPEELLSEGFDAVYAAGRCVETACLDIPGADMKGVIPAEVFLWRVRRSGKYRDSEVGLGDRVVVVGDGEMAVDAARCARRLGARATVLCRCCPEEMAAAESSVRAAREEGVLFKFLCEAAELVGDDGGRIRAVCCRELMSVRSASTGETLLIPLDDADFELEADWVIAAAGPGRGNYVEVAQSAAGSRLAPERGFFRFEGTAEAIEAAAAGVRAAGEIDRFVGKVE